MKNLQETSLRDQGKTKEYWEKETQVRDVLPRRGIGVSRIFRLSELCKHLKKKDKMGN